jgi:hypothetical protein
VLTVWTEEHPAPVCRPVDKNEREIANMPDRPIYHFLPFFSLVLPFEPTGSAGCG